MKIETPTEFLTFCDGLCEIRRIEKNKPGESLATVHYGDRSITAKRYYTARAASEKVDKLIQIPAHPRYVPAVGMCCIIDRIRYDVDAVQFLPTCNPPSYVLTLRHVGVVHDG